MPAAPAAAPKPKGAPRGPRPFAQCPKCHKKFTGVRRAQKLGSHTFQKHTRHTRKTATPKPQTVDTVQNRLLAELERVSSILSIYNDLSLESRAFLSQFLS
jgi:hypothetical protein